MPFKKIVTALLCFGLNFAQDGQNLLSKFVQHDYNVKDFRIDNFNYNKELVQDMSFVYSKYNRTLKTGNLTILTRVDVTKTNTFSFMQVFRRYGNEFKTFGVNFSFYHCQIFDENIVGLGAKTCGKISCPIKKNVRQTLCNWVPDFSRMPPFIPDGEYMFFQHDYDIKDIRVGSLDYNKKLIHDLSFGYRKYNRTTKALNLTCLTLVDLTLNNTSAVLQAYKRYGNEFKEFAIRFPFKYCQALRNEIIGIGTSTSRKFFVSHKKKRSIYYIQLDSRLFPFTSSHSRWRIHGPFKCYL
ncbi:hypothetical protein FQR65_LT12299 [Abscondita terminalis]|nr:hypothetical protein FQR65_LT12299 [Abscondita terminalis]